MKPAGSSSRARLATSSVGYLAGSQSVGACEQRPWRIRTGKAMGRLVGKGADGVACVRAREGAGSNRLASYAARPTVAAILSVRLVGSEVGVIGAVAGEGQRRLLLLCGGRVAGEQTGRHWARIKEGETDGQLKLNEPSRDPREFKWRRASQRERARGPGG